MPSTEAAPLSERRPRAGRSTRTLPSDSRRCGAGANDYEVSGVPELVPGGEVREVVTGIMHQIQKFGKSVKLCSASSEPVPNCGKIIIAEQAEHSAVWCDRPTQQTE